MAATTVSTAKYRDFIRRSNRLVSCRLCNVDVLVKHYKQHLTVEHQLNLKKECEWCGAEGDYTHRYACGKRMLYQKKVDADGEIIAAKRRRKQKQRELVEQQRQAAFELVEQKRLRIEIKKQKQRELVERQRQADEHMQQEKQRLIEEKRQAQLQLVERERRAAEQQRQVDEHKQKLIEEKHQAQLQLVEQQRQIALQKQEMKQKKLQAEAEKLAYQQQREMNVVPWEDDNFVVTDYEFNNKELDEWLKSDTKHGERKFNDSFEQDFGGQLVVENPTFYDARLNIETDYILSWDIKRYCYDHISVRKSAWPSFMEFVRRAINYRFYPYWCCCNGGREVHRHMLVRYARANKKLILSRWKNISSRQLQAKFRKPILTPHHLINAMCYMSNFSSQCAHQTMEGVNEFYHQNEFHGWKNYEEVAIKHGFKKYTKNKHHQGSCHYYINKPLPPYASLFMSLLYEKGINQYLMGKHINKLVDYCYSERNNDGKWIVKIGHLDKTRSLVLPICRNKQLMFDNNSTDKNVLFLPEEKKTTIMDFEDGAEMSVREWNECQLSQGNRFIENIADFAYVLGTKQQQILDAVERMAIEKDAVIREKDQQIKEKDEKMYSIIQEHRAVVREKDELIKQLITLRK